MVRIVNAGDDPKLKQEILVAIFKTVGNVSDIDVPLRNIAVDFQHVDADTLFDAIADLCHAHLLLDLGHGRVALTPKGMKEAKALMEPKAASHKKTTTKEHAPNSSHRNKGTADARDSEQPPANPLKENLTWLVELMAPNLPQLQLPPKEHQQAQEYLAHLKTQIQGAPSLVLVKEICRRLKVIVESPVSTQLASGTQPALWGAVLALLNEF